MPPLVAILLACAAPPPVDAAPTAPSAAAAAPAVATRPTPEWPAPARVVAVGDLHADVAAALDVLRLAGVVDEAGTWSGGETWLVQTGDITDRGTSSHGVIRLLARLEDEAARAGGRVVALLGNHEVMNLHGDWRYVSPDDLAEYGGEAARKAAYTAAGEDGAWLLRRDAVAKVGDTVFVHGGVDARWASLGLPTLTARIHAAVVGDGPEDVLGPDGPLWNRAYLLGDEATICPEADRALAALGATRMVMGHTAQESGRIASRCGGKLLGIDTGISAHYGRHLAALELRGAEVTEHYPPTADAR